MSLLSSPLFLRQCPTCLVLWMVFEMGGRWPYSCCFAGCSSQDLFNIARSILVQLPSSFFSIRLVSVQVVHPYSSMDTTAAWKKLRFTLSDRSDFHMIDSLLIAVHAFASRVLMSFSEMRRCFRDSCTQELLLSVHSFNAFKYCYLTLIILFNINHLFANSEILSSIAI